MSEAVAAARDRVTPPDSEKPKQPPSLTRADYVMQFVQESDLHETARRRYDRIGGNLYYDRHWNVPMPQGRVALTVNIAKALIDHKVAIMCKQEPIPVVEPSDMGDPEAARLMKSVLMDWWRRDGMQEKLEQAETIANCTRTTALKVIPDYTLYGGAGDVTVDVVPPWRLILDPLSRDRRRMRFCGDRAIMSRARAMTLYPAAAETIALGVGPQSFDPSGASATSPIKDGWARMAVAYPGVAQIDGLWTLAGYTSTGVTQADPAKSMVELAEVYYKDPALVPKQVPVKNERGEVQQQPALDEDGAMKWTQTSHELVTLDDGTQSHMPNFKLELEDMYEEKMVPKYPYWRRTTIMLPDIIELEDVAWDYPLPYSFIRDGETLEGLWCKGTMLALEDLQAQLNVSLSLMMDNLRFSSHRVAVAYEGSQLQRNNLSVAPGDILEVAGSAGTLQFLDFPQISEAWFTWITNTINLMQQIVGVTGIMQGEAAGRVDSTSAYDLLSEIAGSRLTKATQRMERAIEELMEVVGALIQDMYDERRAVRVEDLEGNINFQRIGPNSLQGAFNYNIVTGSTLAWHESGVRARVVQEYQLGFRDWINAAQRLDIDGWRETYKRMKEAGATFAPPPPQRTRQQIPKQTPSNKKQGMPKA